jgi:tetraacyldisaccharide 4'-kinase
VNPLSALFGAGVALRNRLYDSRTFHHERLQHPVVSVGNLSVGGSGKTPFVMLLGRLLQENKIAFDILSRGYGRDDDQIRLVDPKGKASSYGDETLLLARQLEVPVVVGGDRVAAGRYAEKLFAEAKPAHGKWLHVLDDGFQHRRLWRDFDIVLLSKNDLNDSLLPGGRLREPLSSLRRTAAIVLTDDTDQSDLPEVARRKQILRVARRVSLASPTPGKVVAFCGIARPHRFFADLESLGIKTDPRRVFRDHHRYTQIDAENLLALKKQSGAQAFITTAKDMVNLESAGLLPALQPVIELSLRMEFVSPEPAHVFQTIMQEIANRRS